MAPIVVYLLVFVAVASLFLTLNLLLGRLLRRDRPDAEKGTTYECGEPTLGSSWVQFDLRFYVIALLFVVFDVEMALLFPWAAAFGTTQQLAQENLSDSRRAELQARFQPSAGVDASPAPADASRSAARGLAWLAFAELLAFLLLLLLGFAYLCKRGDLDWVRSLAAQEPPGARP